MSATTTICARCGGAEVDSGTCRGCGAPEGALPSAPPATPRCPVCGSVTPAGASACPGCGLVVPGAAGRADEQGAAVGPLAPWQVALGALAILGVVVLAALAVAALGRGGPPGLDERWRVELTTTASSAPVVGGGVAVVGGEDGTVVAVDARSGEPRWRFETERRATAPVALTDELAVVATVGDRGGGLVFAVDLRTGQERWRVATDIPVTAAPAVDDDAVYLAVGDLAAHGVDDGALRWRVPVAGGAGGPAVGRGVVVAGAGAGGVVVVSAEDGAPRWSTVGAVPGAAPAVVGGLVVVDDGAGAVVARSAAGGQERWRVEVGGHLVQPAVPGPGSVLVATTGGARALAVADGSTGWRVGPSGDEGIRVAAAGGDVVVSSARRTAVVDALTGGTLASASRAATGAPAITADDLVLVTEGDQLVALRQRTG